MLGVRGTHVESLMVIQAGRENAEAELRMLGVVTGIKRSVTDCVPSAFPRPAHSYTYPSPSGYYLLLLEALAIPWTDE